MLVTNRPLFVSHQYAALAPRPTGRIAERSFSETPNTAGALAEPLGWCDDILSSSPIVLTSRRRGEPAAAAVVDPTVETVGSDTLVTVAPDSRSNQSLPMMPLTDSVAPLNIVAWPGAVTVG